MGIDEIDTARGHISWKSPIGKGLLGKELGDEVNIKTPGGIKEFTVTKVIYQKIEVQEFVYEDPSKRQLG